jgi:hypothetical protein
MSGPSLLSAEAHVAGMAGVDGIRGAPAKQLARQPGRAGPFPPSTRSKQGGYSIMESVLYEQYMYSSYLSPLWNSPTSAPLEK